MTDPDPTMLIAADPLAPLSMRQESLAVIAALAAADGEPRLNGPLHDGLDAGLTISEIGQVLRLVHTWAGSAARIGAQSEFERVLKARRRPGKVDDRARVCVLQMQAGTRGLAARLAKRGTEGKASLAAAQPDAAHVFPAGDWLGDIERCELDAKDEQIATLSILAAVGGTASDLRAQMQWAMRVGLTPIQLHILAQVLETHIGTASIHRLLDALAACLPGTRH